MGNEVLFLLSQQQFFQGNLMLTFDRKGRGKRWIKKTGWWITFMVYGQLVNLSFVGRSSSIRYPMQE